MTSQPIDSRLPAGNPKILVDVDVVPNRSSGNTYSAKSINKARVGTGCTLQDLWLVELFCIKPSLFIKHVGKEARLIRVLKGDKRATFQKYLSSSFDIHRIIIIDPQVGSPPRTQE